MKENTETISEIIFTHFPSDYSGRNLTGKLFKNLKKQTRVFKRHLLNGAASLGIGTVLLIGVYLFFIQLAEYGWQ